ncbi:MAG: MFS transporter [Deltaproteobacteria bacterium]|nr:MAG: MFS transporter [Deltaproteobacteria bacterium]
MDAVRGKPYQVLLVVSVGTLLSAMTGSMVNLALPSLGRDLGISLQASRWVVQVLLLVMGALLLPAGRLADGLGHRLVYLWGFVLFATASLLCGLAPSFAWLVVARALQGIGGALILATSPALLTLSFPPQQRGRALGLQATATYLGLALGPALGGVIVAGLGWRWTFLVYVPASLLILVLGLFLLPRGGNRLGTPPDLLATGQLLLGMPLLLLGLSWSRDGVLSPRVLVPVFTGMVLLIAFSRRQGRLDSPVLDLGLFHSRVFFSSVLAALCNYVALFVALIMLPFYLEEGLGMPTQRVGLVLTVQPALMALVASPAGWLSDRIGSRGLAAGGLALVAAGLWWLAGLGAGTGLPSIVAGLAAVGLGVGLFVSPNTSALMGSAPRHQQGQAGAMMAESRILGMFLGVALASAVFAALGGRTGHAWQPVEFRALAGALRSGALAALAGALLAWLRGRS